MTETPDGAPAVVADSAEVCAAQEPETAAESRASPPPSPHKKPHSKTSSRRKHEDGTGKKKEKKSRKSKSTSPEEPGREPGSSEPPSTAALGSDPSSVSTSETDDTDDAPPQTSAAHRHSQSHAKDVGRAVTAPPASESLVEHQANGEAATSPVDSKQKEQEQEQEQQKEQQEKKEEEKKTDKKGETEKTVVTATPGGASADAGKDYAQRMMQYDRTLAGKERATSLTATLDAARVRNYKRRSKSQQQAESLLLKSDAPAGHMDTEGTTGDSTPAALSPTSAATKKANRATRIGVGGLVVSPQGAGLAAPWSGTSSSNSETSSEVSPKAKAKAAFPYTKKDALGRGLQGRTWRGTSAETEAEVVIKDYDTRRVSLRHVRRLGSVGALLRPLSHENVARVLDVAYVGKHVYAATEYVEGVSLRHLLDQYGPLSEQLVAVCTEQVLRALEYLHNHGVTHAALHPGNVLVDLANGRCKLTDICVLHAAEVLDCSSHSSNSNSSKNSSSSGNNSGNGTTGTNKESEDQTNDDPEDVLDSSGFAAISGRPFYMGPEVAGLYPGVVPASDVWALGATCVELATGQPPFGDQHPVTALHSVVSGAPIAALADAGLSEDLREFLGACFTRDYTERPGPASLLARAFVRRHCDEADVGEMTRGLVLSHMRNGAGGAAAGGAKGPAGCVGRAPPEAQSTASAVSGLLMEFTDEDEAEALAMAQDPLAQLRAESERVVETLEAESRAAAPDLSALPRMLGSCVDAQEFLVSFFQQLRRQRDAARRARERDRGLLAAHRAERDAAVQTAVRATGQAEQLLDTLRHLESYYRREGADKLAAILYGRISGECLAGAHSGLLDTLVIASHKWRTAWVVLRDNILFFYKSGAAGKPTDVLIVDAAGAAPVPDAQLRRQHAFIVAGQTLAAQSDTDMWAWINSINAASPWYERKELGASAASAASSTSAGASAAAAAAPTRRRNIFSKLFSVDEVGLTQSLPHQSSAAGALSPSSTSFAGSPRSSHLRARQTMGNGGGTAASPLAAGAGAGGAGAGGADHGRGAGDAGAEGAEQRRVFGVPIERVAAQDPAEDDTTVPAVLDVLVKDICARGLEEEGILRVSGSHSEMEEIRRVFEQTPHARDVDLRQYDVRSVGGTMKAWLREVPHGFLTCTSQRQQEIVEWSQTHQTLDTGTATEYRQMLEAAMPATHLSVLRVLSRLVCSITAHADVNKMTTENVLTCLLPSMKVPTVVFIRIVQNLDLMYPPTH